MVANLFALGMLSSFTVLGAAVLKRSFEDCLPVGIIASVAVLYLFYIVDLLMVGFYVTFIAAIACYVFSLYYLIRYKNWKEMMSHLITPGFVIFALSICAFVLLQKNQVVSLWDEFRLWADTPKALVYTAERQIGAMGEISWYTPPCSPILE